jgi:hypothetical protein
MPFGFPVVPDVYVSRYGCSESTSSGGSSPGDSATALSHHTSRPACIATFAPSRRQTTIASSDGACCAASSAIAFIGTSRPRRSDASAVMSTFASASCSRAATAGAAKPEKTGTWIAPTCAHACEAIATSTDMGR